MGGLAKKLIASAGGEEKLYSNDVFSAYLYTGNGSTQTINNGIDLAGRGGLVWIKSRSAGGTSAYDHFLTYGDFTKFLRSNTTQAAFSNTTLTPSSTGFDMLNGYTQFNDNAVTYASWTFRKAPKFFDCGTYTGDGANEKVINHGLGVTPGMIIVKRYSSGSYDWVVYHRSTPSGTLYLNTTAGVNGYPHVFNVTSSTFSVEYSPIINAINETYVWYAFAHDTSADGIIQCGSFTTDGSGNFEAALGWEPQFVLYKRADGLGDWIMLDTMRGFTVTGDDYLRANLTNAEANTSALMHPFATGFKNDPNGFGGSATYIYLAIRRPNKPPKSGTQVYNAIARTGTGSAATVTGVGFTPDLILSDSKDFAFTGGAGVIDRLRGSSFALQTTTPAGDVNAAGAVVSIDQNGFTVGPDSTYGWFNLSGGYIHHFFRRAPGFFDVVCYTGDGSSPTRSIPHNLGATPELIIHKYRNVAGTNWNVYLQSLGTNAGLILNGSNATITPRDLFDAPSASNFVVKQSSGDTSGMNWTGTTYVTYLFATLAGISKVGSYTGNGSSQTINCGFTTGSRFILIKRTDSTGDWYVWDSARGIVSANDPHLSLNTTAAEVTTNDSVDPESSGFIVNQNTTTNINVNGGSYIFLAIA